MLIVANAPHDETKWTAFWIIKEYKMSKLDEIRRKLQAQESNKSTSQSSGELFTHWDAPTGSSTRIRFLPDSNEDNTFFWVEKKMLKFDFPGIKGHDESKPVTVQVPCMEMYEGEKCPVLTEIRPWWKNPDLEDLARKYWVKRSYLFQGFVQDCPFEEENAPENPIRTFNMSNSIFKLIKSSLMDPDFDNIPTDYINGTDFIIEKTQQGNYADYTTSKWARKETALTEEQLEAIEQYGLKELSSLLPKKPTADQVELIEQMFHDSVEGELYDPEKYANHFRPYGFEWNGGKSEAPAAQRKADTSTKPAETKVAPKAQPKVEESDDSDDEPPFEADNKPASGGRSAQDILAQIRARSNNS